MCFQVVPRRDIRAKVPGKGAKVRLKCIRKVETKVSRCIEVDSADRLFAVGGDDGQSILSHNSVAQRNVFLGCAMRPDNWIFTGIDLKRVELSGLRAYKDVVAGIATELEDAVTILRWAQEVMMSRYTQMEELGINNFLDLPGGGKALMVMVDEAGELLSPSGVKTEQGKHEDSLRGEASQILGSIARLGRAAGVHMLVATQRPDASIIKGELKANLTTRINCGRTDSNASLMILGSPEGTRVRSNPRGRIYVQAHGKGLHGQGFFADPNWYDEWLEGQGLNPDRTPIPGWKPPVADDEPSEPTESSEAKTETKPEPKPKRAKKPEPKDEPPRDYGGISGPAMGAGDNSSQRTKRYEDDYDLDALIEENES